MYQCSGQFYASCSHQLPLPPFAMLNFVFAYLLSMWWLRKRLNFVFGGAGAVWKKTEINFLGCCQSRSRRIFPFHEHFLWGAFPLHDC